MNIHPTALFVFFSLLYSFSYMHLLLLLLLVFGKQYIAIKTKAPIHPLGQRELMSN